MGLIQSPASKIQHSRKVPVKLFSRLLLLLGADLVSKVLVRSLMSPEQSVGILPFLHLEYVRNQGIAFGILEGHAAAIIVASSIVVALLALAAFALRRDSRWNWAFALLGAGSIGNLADRAWSGSVTDFIRLPHWPAFNLADAFIVAGVLLLVKGLLWKW